jgi:tripartite-type tricarboxylate transporter receptor subunit TctC
LFFLERLQNNSRRGISMRRFKNVLAPVAAIALAAMSLTACGGSSSSTASTTAAATTAAATEAAKAEETKAAETEAAAATQTDYPKKGISVICPWSAGGGTDACLRAFSEALGKDLGVTLTVDNQTGGGGILGHQAIADADPDGYTLGMITFEISTYKKLGTSDLTWEDYDPLCRVNTDAAAVTVNAKWAEENGITDLASYIDYCKAHPGEVQMGGSSNASVWHIAGGYLMQATGIDIQMITYQEGAATAVQNAAGGFIQGVTVSLAEARSFIESGDLICLGVMDEERNASFPDVPTCKEQGYDITYFTQRGMAIPKGVDPAIKARLEEACAKAIEDPDFVEFMNNNGQTIAYLNSADYSDFLKQSAEDVANAMDVLGL